MGMVTMGKGRQRKDEMLVTVIRRKDDAVKNILAAERIRIR